MSLPFVEVTTPERGLPVRVRMKIHVTGFRNGEPWPDRGGDIEVPDHEAADLIAAGLAEETTDAHEDHGPADEPTREPAAHSGQAAGAGDNQPPAPAPQPVAPAKRQAKKAAAKKQAAAKSTS